MGLTLCKRAYSGVRLCVYAADLDLAEFAASDVKEVALTANAAPSVPPANSITLFTHADTLQYVDDTSTIYQVATTTQLGSSLPLAGTLSWNLDGRK